jgi:hypothetical protein
MSKNEVLCCMINWLGVAPLETDWYGTNAWAPI